MKIASNERPKPKWVVAWGCESNQTGRIGQPAKIGRLPRGVRENLNQRLEQGESATRLAKWLNGLPQTQSASPGNSRCAKIAVEDIGKWKRGGFRDWERERELRLDIAGHCLNWANNQSTQEKLYGPRQTWLEIENEIRKIFGREQLRPEDVPDEWNEIPTPKERKIAAYGMMGMTPDGKPQSETMGYFGPPRAKSRSKKRIKPRKL